ncbi:hypothetical protein [Neobacillus mesonae]|uniref:hypothetical protein n=1 Tax=Neobacillus mesonae TaxID=1193713 RepID=UPI0025748499|nr:hypothetical protein [Neobacillus mesonae]
MSEVIEFFNFTIQPKLKSTKEYFEATLYQLESKFTETTPFTDSFSIMIKKSFLITTYSILEQELSIFTKLIQMKSTSNIKIDDLKHRGIYRDYIYLTKVIGFKLESDINWRKIQVYNRIRNYFVHEPRNVLSQMEVKKLSNSKVPYIKFKKESNDKDRYVLTEIDSNLIIDFLTTIEMFLKELFIEAYKKEYFK